MQREGVRLARVYYPSYTDGPGGPRVVVWFQGCSIRCPGCQNPNLWDADHEGTRSQVIQAEALAETLVNSGLPITISGGEPFDQLAGLAALVVAIRKRDEDRHIIIYTGRTLDAIMAEYDELYRVADTQAAYDEMRMGRADKIETVLRLADVLVDGPYRQDLDGPYMEHMGSANQRAIDLSLSCLAGLFEVPPDVLKPVVATLDWGPAIQVHDGKLIATGGMSEALGLEALGEVKEIPRCGQAER